MKEIKMAVLENFFGGKEVALIFAIPNGNNVLLKQQKSV